MADQLELAFRQVPMRSRRSKDSNQVKTNYRST